MAQTLKSIKATYGVLAENCKQFPGIEVKDISKVKTIKEAQDILTDLESVYLRTVQAMGPEPSKVITEATKEDIVDLLKSSGDNPPNTETQLVQCALDTEYFSGSLWQMTGKVMANEREKFDLAGDDCKKKMAINFATLLNDRVDPSLIPEKGLDRKGEIITLRKKDGKVKWSSWEVTARMVQNTSSIFRGIELLGYERVFPNNILLPLNQLVKLIGEEEPEKDKEAPAMTVKRFLEMATKKLAEIATIEDLLSCDDFVAALVEGYKEQLENLRAEAMA